ncbi:MAG: aminodeoxychorismate lyase [Gammaproteobacteria bacterium]
MILVDGIATTAIEATDRGLAYGDGLFETIAWLDGRALALDAHLARLSRDARRLGIEAPNGQVLANELRRLGRHRDRGVIKIIVTRGSGGRGYRDTRTGAARRIVSIHAWPELPALDATLSAFLCRHPISSNPVTAGIKHLNRLDQVMASREWPGDDCFEGLMRDGAGHLVEGTRSNIFLCRGDILVTPSLEMGGVAGVVRAAVLEIAPELGLRCEVRNIAVDELAQADELFVTNSIIGLRSITDVRGDERWCYATVARARALADRLREAGVTP